MGDGPFQKFKKICGIDPGSNECGVVFFEEGVLQSSRTLLSDQPTPLLRRIQIAVFLRDILKDADLIICEEPFLRGPPNQTMQRLLGSIEWIAGERIRFIAPMSVKAFSGSGKNDKMQVAKGILKFLSSEEVSLVEKLILQERWNETDAVAVVLAWVSKQKEKEMEMAKKKTASKKTGSAKGGKGKSKGKVAKGSMMSGKYC